MKLRKLLVLLLLLGAAFVLSACAQDGEKGATGPKGETGDTGIAGTNGTNGTDGADGVNGTNGTDGVGIEFSTTSDGIVWRYVGATEWTVGVEYADIFSAIAEYRLTPIINEKQIGYFVDPTVSDLEANESVVKFGKTLTKGVNIFATVAEALVVAEAEAAKTDYTSFKLYVGSGTYEDALTINAKNVEIYGPNMGIKGNAKRYSEAVITGLVKIKGNDCKFDGVEFTEGGGIVIAADNTTLTNIRTSANPISGTAGVANNRKACIVDSCGIDGEPTVVKNVVITDSYINVPGEVSVYTRDYMDFTHVENLTITGNYITNSGALEMDATAASDGLMIYTMDGELIINNNEFRYATNNWLMRVGTFTSAGCTKVEFNDNIVAGCNDLVTCTVGLTKLGATCVVTIRGNQFYDCEPSTFSFGSSVAGCQVTIEYNYFDASQTFKVTTGSATVTVMHNCYMGGFHASDGSAASTKDTAKFTSLEALLAAYAAAYPEA